MRYSVAAALVAAGLVGACTVNEDVGPRRFTDATNAGGYTTGFSGPGGVNESPLFAPAFNNQAALPASQWR